MFSIPITPELVVGAAELERTERGWRPHRLPSHVRERDADPQLTMVEAQPSGVRVVLATTARRVELDVHASRVSYPGITRPRGAVDVVVDGALVQSRVLQEGDAVELDPRTGAPTVVPGGVDGIEVDLPGTGESTVELWLPHNEQIEILALRADAPVRAVPAEGPLWLHHGSSISHGSNAAAPTGIWPVVAARRAGVQLRNLGVGGSALVDPFMARVIRDSPADVISVKLGINVVNLDAMRLRAFVPAVHGFLDTIREGHPDTPLLLVSPIHCGIHERTPGPGAIDPAGFATGAMRFLATGAEGDTAGGRLTLTVIRDALQQIVAARADDPRLRYLDGLDLFGARDEQAMPLPDALHPSTEAHALIGARFAERAFGPGGLLR
ncbi:GDSL-type esterase/lipase family protein [Microcella daejeonensis]|uniref:GDSL-type esterase/lipase family protein n=1 Tax=Microcella daejeonensis TaxID=2994971 RepID=UPI00226FE513|nr:GDSL-type esterase/lipase family protein [Microcella daejeonensis]WAB83786.1 GDSL-type esterase/lipase family protein [Microcella daejeonensis]